MNDAAFGLAAVREVLDHWKASRPGRGRTEGQTAVYTAAYSGRLGF